jgi:hypothetical protein
MYVAVALGFTLINYGLSKLAEYVQHRASSSRAQPPNQEQYAHRDVDDRDDDRHGDDRGVELELAADLAADVQQLLVWMMKPKAVSLSRTTSWLMIVGSIAVRACGSSTAVITFAEPVSPTGVGVDGVGTAAGGASA